MVFESGVAQPFTRSKSAPRSMVGAFVDVGIAVMVGEAVGTLQSLSRLISLI